MYFPHSSHLAFSEIVHQVKSAMLLGIKIVHQVKSAMLLGIKLDNNQKWTSHLTGTGGVTSALNKRLSLLKRLKIT